MLPLLMLLSAGCTAGSDRGDDDDETDREWNAAVGPSGGSWSFRFSEASMNTLFGVDPAPSDDTATLQPVAFGDSIVGDEYVDLIGLWPNTTSGPSLPVDSEGGFEFSSDFSGGGAATDPAFPCIDGFSKSGGTVIEGAFTSGATLDGSIRVTVAYATGGDCPDSDIIRYANVYDSTPSFWGADVIAVEGSYQVSFVGFHVME